MKDCKCLDTIREKLTKHHGDGSNVELELKQTINITTLDFGTDLPPLRYSYKDGNKRKKSFVTFSYCPFCGKKCK